MKKYKIMELPKNKFSDKRSLLTLACVFIFTILFLFGNRSSEFESFKIIYSNKSIFSSEIDYSLILRNCFGFSISILLICLSGGLGSFAFSLLKIEVKGGVENILAVAAGAGFLSIIIMLTASLIGTSPLILSTVIGAIAISNIKYVMCFIGNIFKGLNSYKMTKKSLFPVIFIVFMVTASAINLFASSLPPFEYDSLEYHLAGPAEFLRIGKLDYLPHNMYTNIPSNLSMLFLLPQSVFNQSGKTIVFFFGILTLMLIYSYVSRKSNGIYGLIAASMFYISALITRESMYAHNEICAAFFAAAAFISLLIYMEVNRNPYLVLSAIFSGFALGTKYTILLTLITPVFFVLLLHSLSSKNFKPIYIYTGLALFSFLPWMVKNWIYTGNPVYPFLNTVFLAESWTDEIAARFSKSHFSSPGLFIKNIKSFVHFSFQDYFGTPVMILSAIPILLTVKRNPAVKNAGLAFIAGLTAWAVFTRGYLRFLIPLVPFICISGALAFSEINLKGSRFRILCYMFLIIFAMNITVSAMLFMEGEYLRVFSSLRAKEYFLENANNHYSAVSFLNKKIAPNDKVLYIGEARTYYALYEPVYNTVFNESILETLGYGRKDINQIVSDNNIKYILINNTELQRIDKTYRYKPAKNTLRLLKKIDKSFDKLYENPKKGTIIYKVD